MEQFIAGWLKCSDAILDDIKCMKSFILFELVKLKLRDNKAARHKKGAKIYITKILKNGTVKKSKHAG